MNIIKEFIIIHLKTGLKKRKPQQTIRNHKSRYQRDIHSIQSGFELLHCVNVNGFLFGDLFY